MTERSGSFTWSSRFPDFTPLVFSYCGYKQNAVPVPPTPTILPEVAGLIRVTEAAVRPAALTNIRTDLHCAILLMVTLLNVCKLSSSEHVNLITFSPVTGLEWPRGFQEVKVPRFHDNGTGRW